MSEKHDINRVAQSMTSRTIDRIDSRNTHAKIFLSHSHHDVEWCSRLAESLRDQGFQVWIDKDCMQLADTIPANVSTALADSRAFVVVISRHSLQSNWVAQEMEVALHRKLSDDTMDIFIVVIEDVTPWPKRYELLTPMPRIHFFGQPYDVALGQLISGLREHQITLAPKSHRANGDTAVPMEIATHRQEAHQGPVLCIRLSHNGRFLASGGADEVIRIWDWQSHALLHSLRLRPAGSNWIRSLAWSPDDTHIIGIGDNEFGSVWNIASEICVSTFPSVSEYTLDFTWTDAGLGSISRSGLVRFHYYVNSTSRFIPSGEILLGRHAAPIFAACWQSTELAFAATARDGSVIIRSPHRKSAALPAANWTGKRDEIRALKWSWDGTSLGALYRNGRVIIWDVESQTVISDWETKQPNPRDLYWLGSQDTVAVADGSGDIRVWNIRPLDLVALTGISGARILDVATFSRDRRFCMALASGELCFSMLSSKNSNSR